MIKNDFAAAPGTCTTFFTQGCNFHCKGCHNPQTWDFNGGKELTKNVLEELREALISNGIHRDLCIMGGEPLCDENLCVTKLVIDYVKSCFKDIKIYIWTGYTLEELKQRNSEFLTHILDNVDVLIDGRFEKNNRDVTLFMRGSTNQRILYKGKDF